jgi:hypothetical protein
MMLRGVVENSFGKETPWGSADSEAFVTVVESALERSLSKKLMSGAAKPRISKVKPAPFSWLKVMKDQRSSWSSTA